MSRVDFGAKPYLYPMPVLIIGTYDENGVPNAMNAAWGTITDYNEITISMAPHKTTENLAVTGAFTVSIATEDTARRDREANRKARDRSPTHIRICGGVGADGRCG